MADSQSKVRDVAWSELFPWLMLLKSVRIALMARVLLLGAAGIIATTVGWWLLAEVFSRSTDPVVGGWRHKTSLQIWVDSVQTQPDRTWPNTSAHSTDE